MISLEDIEIIRRGGKKAKNRLNNILDGVRIDKRVTQKGWLSYEARLTGIEGQEVTLLASRYPCSLWPPRLPQYNVSFSYKQIPLERTENSSPANTKIDSGRRRTFKIIEKIYYKKEGV